jgi:hypothetical protein
MRYERFILLAALTTFAACGPLRPHRHATAACLPRPHTAGLEAELRRVAQDTARTNELERLLADTSNYAELRRTLEDLGTAAELQRHLADTTRMAAARPLVGDLERELARVRACGATEGTTR